MRERAQVNSSEDGKPLTRHIRIDAKLHKALKILAAENEVSMVHVINDLFRRHIEESSRIVAGDK